MSNFQENQLYRSDWKKKAAAHAEFNEFSERAAQSLATVITDKAGEFGKAAQRKYNKYDIFWVHVAIGPIFYIIISWYVCIARCVDGPLLEEIG